MQAVAYLIRIVLGVGSHRHHSGRSLPRYRTHLDGLLGIRLLHHPDDSISDEDEEDDGGLDKGGPFVVTLLEQGEAKGDDGRDEEDDDELVLKLFEDELPQWGSGLLRDLCEVFESAQVGRLSPRRDEGWSWVVCRRELRYQKYTRVGTQRVVDEFRSVRQGKLSDRTG